MFCSSHRTPTSERQSKGKQFEAEAMRDAHGLEVPGSAGSSRPVDGEQQQEMSRPKNSYSQKNHAGNGNGSERLSQSHVLHKTRSTDYDPDIPISIEDIYGGSLNGCPGPSDWTIKLEKYQSEEERLRERVWELAEQNVSLQREVSSFHEREAESRKFELKAETLLTNLLLEKLYSMESEVEQLQVELAAAVRGNDILRAEVQNTQDDLSYATYKLKDLELQVILSCHQ